MLPSVAATISNDEKNLIEMASLCGLNRLYLKLRPYDGLKLFVRSRATAHAGTISKKFQCQIFCYLHPCSMCVSKWKGGPQVMMRSSETSPFIGCAMTPASRSLPLTLFDASCPCNDDADVASRKSKPLTTDQLKSSIRTILTLEKKRP